MSWTGGPWEFLPEDSGFIGYDPYFLIVDEWNRGIAYILPRDRPVQKPIKEWQENGYLIAAAPDLYDALSGIISNMAEYGHADESWFEAGLSALQKARGEKKGASND